MGTSIGWGMGWISQIRAWRSSAVDRMRERGGEERGKVARKEGREGREERREREGRGEEGGGEERGNEGQRRKEGKRKSETEKKVSHMPNMLKAMFKHPTIGQLPLASYEASDTYQQCKYGRRSEVPM